MEMYDQMEFDMTLESERDLKENVQVAVDFACKQLKNQELDTVRNRHEGYGIAAENWTKLQGATAKIKSDMASFMKVLEATDTEAINAASSLYNSACEMAYEAVRMAAQANRIMNDLYMHQPEPTKTPIEECLEDRDADGFSEAEDQEE